MDFNPEELLRNFYGCDCISITQLTGYDDLNFIIEIGTDTQQHVKKGKYTLKVINKIDTARHGMVEGIMEVLDILPKMDFCVPKPMRNIDGNRVCYISFEGSTHSVVLLSYIKGLDYKELRFSAENYIQLCKHIGHTAGLISAALQNIKHFSPSLERLDCQYMTINIHLSHKKLKIINDEKVRAICSKVMDVLERLRSNPSCNQLRKMVIHNDLCIENFVFNITSDGSYCVSGVIDFSDMTYCYLIFEVAIVIASAMYQTHFIPEMDPYIAARAVLCGYQNNFRLAKQELDFLYYAVVARFVSLRVVGGYDVLESSNTAEHEEHNSESLSYFISLLWAGGKEKFDKAVFGSEQK